MAKEKKIDFEKLEPLFSGKKVKKERFSNEIILEVVRNPLTLQEIPRQQRLNFWTFVVERMMESSEFRKEVLETLEKVKKEE
ncbi:MAG: hypothetical protein WBE27_02730 [Microgenomates group bacterium]